MVEHMKGQTMNDSVIHLDHGSGGRLSYQLITRHIVPVFDNPILKQLDDGAVFDIDRIRLAFSTDSFTVDPIFFPGGDIGELAVNGTVNDLAMCGAVPKYLSCGMIIEAGFSMADLNRILDSMRLAAKKADVQIVTGDTKVVPKRAADKVFINTSGVGLVPPGVEIGGHLARVGDKVILSGPIADHGITILINREKMDFESAVKSDTAPLNHMVYAMIQQGGGVHVLRDPTRGGLATALNEIALQSQVGIGIYEANIPVNTETSSICELLGFDPLYMANEGKLIACVAPDHADSVLEVIQKHAFGIDASIIGEVVADHPGRVFMKTRIGGTRIVDMLTGEPFPRIC